MGSKISKVGPSSYETDPPICASMPFLGKRIYIQDPTKKIDMAFPLWRWQHLKLLKCVGILRQNPNANLNVKTKGGLKRNARFLKCVEVLRHNLNANLNVKIKGSLK